MRALAALLCLGAAKPVLVPDVSRAAGADRLQLHRRRPAAVRRDPLSAGPRARSTAADIAVVLKGPTQSILVREKQKVAGMWVNADSARFRSAPSFYAIATSRPLGAAGRRAHRGDLRARARQPAALARLERAARRAGSASSRGWSTSSAAPGSMSRMRSGVEITDGVLYRARIDDAGARAGRPLRRRDLPDPATARSSPARCARCGSANPGSSASSSHRRASLAGQLRAGRGRAVARDRLGRGRALPPRLSRGCRLNRLFTACALGYVRPRAGVQRGRYWHGADLLTTARPTRRRDAPARRWSRSAA